MRINKTNNLTFRQKYELIPPDKLAQKLKQFYTYGQIAQEYNVTEDVVFRSVKKMIESSAEEKIKIYKLFQNSYSLEE